MADTPKIRFKGFADAWEQRKLGEIAGRTYGGGTPKTNIMEYWDGYIPWIQSSNLMEHELFNSDIQKYITDEGLAKSAAQLVPPNSIAVVSHVGVGKLVFIPFKYTTSQDFISLSELKAEPIFTCYSIYKRLQNDIHIVQGSAIKGITKDDLLSKEILLPSEPEQTKIGMYFRKLDHLITLHQHKCDETKELKKYMLQKMFPRNGKKNPEIRFAGFTDDWEQRKFSDFTWASGKRNKEDLDLEPYAITNEHGFIPQSEAHDEFGYMKDTDRKAYNIVTPNSFAYNPARINVGSIGYYEGTENVIVSSLYEVFQTADYVDDRFLWHWFKSNEFPKWIERLQEGSVRLYFYYDKLCECQILMPSVAEQKKIATSLDHLDHLITLHQRKCDELKEVKKFMLQNMFPQKG